MGVEGRRGRECVTSTLPEHNASRTCHFPFFHVSLYSMYFSFPSFASFSYVSIFSCFFFLPVVTFSFYFFATFFVVFFYLLIPPPLAIFSFLYLPIPYHVPLSSLPLQPCSVIPLPLPHPLSSPHIFPFSALCPPFLSCLLYSLSYYFTRHFSLLLFSLDLFVSPRILLSFLSLSCFFGLSVCHRVSSPTRSLQVQSSSVWDV